MDRTSPPYSATAGCASDGRTSISDPGEPGRSAILSRFGTEHSYCLTGRKGAAWLTLKVVSHARLSSQLPSFFQGDAVAGSVELDLADEESIKGVSITVSRDESGRLNGLCLPS